VVGAYLFAIIPAISHIEMLIAALAPAFLLYGFLIARPTTSFIGMALAANTATLLALQSTYSADFASYANSAIAFMIGMVMATVVTKLARSVGADWIARRLMKTGWTTLAVTAERRSRNDRAAFAGLMLDRLGLLAQRLAAITESDRSDVESLSQLRVGINAPKHVAVHREEIYERIKREQQGDGSGGGNAGDSDRAPEKSAGYA